MTRSIDVQGHYLPDAQRHALADRAERDDAFRALVAAAADASSPVRRVDDERVAAMDAARLDVQVLSLLPPGVGFVAREEAAALAHEANDALIDAASTYPGRFLVVASVPLPHVAEALAELERVADHPLVRGIQFIAETTDWTLDEERFTPVFARASELGLLAVLHPALEPLTRGYHGWGLGASVAPMVSNTLSGLRLVFSGMLDRVPDLALIVPHLGGTIPYLVRRIADLNGRGDAEHDLVYYLRNRIYFDSCSYHPEALRCAIETAGGDRIMLASDYPFRGSLDICVQDIEESGLPPETREAILGGTASRWFDPGT